MTQLDRRRALRLFAGAGMAGASVPLLGACSAIGSSGDGGKPIKIGMVVAQTGVFNPIGLDMTQGFELYVQQNNSRLGGHRVELIQADEGGDGAGKTGLEATRKLLEQDKVSVLTGVASSAVMKAIRDVVEKAQVPLLGSNASPVAMTGVKYIWRTSFVNDDPGRALGKYCADLGKKFAIIAADYPAGDDEVEGFQRIFEDSGGRLAGTPIRPSFPQVDNWSKHMDELKRSSAEAVFAFFAGSQAVQFVQEYRKARVGLPLYAPGFLTEGSVLGQQKASAAGVYTSLNYSPDLDNAANRQFVTAYQSAYNSLPSTYAMASYDAAAVIDKALALAGADTSPKAINAAIGRIGQIESPRGFWQFNQSRCPQQKWYLRKVVADGKIMSNTVVSDLLTSE